MRVITGPTVCRVVGRTLDPTGANTISDASTLLVNAAHRVLRPGAFAGLHLAEALAVRVWLARDSVQEIIRSARSAVRIAVPRTTSANGVCAVATNALLVCTTLSIARARAGFRLHLAVLVAILVHLACCFAREKEC